MSKNVFIEYLFLCRCLESPLKVPLGWGAGVGKLLVMPCRNDGNQIQEGKRLWVSAKGYIW